MKNIKNILIIFSFLALMFTGCKKNERMTFEGKQALYFADVTVEDSTSYSFTMTEELEDTLYAKVRLLGKPFDKDMAFNLEILDGTTAVEGTHFKELSNYTLEAGETDIMVPLYLLYTPELDDTILELRLAIVADDNFDIAYEAQNYYRLKITNMLVKPIYWDDFFFMYFGDYSEVKHEKFILLYGHDFPLTEDNMNYTYYMLAGRELAMYFAENPTLDENGKLIEVWSPF